MLEIHDVDCLGELCAPQLDRCWIQQQARSSLQSSLQFPHINSAVHSVADRLSATRLHSTNGIINLQYASRKPGRYRRKHASRFRCSRCQPPRDDAERLPRLVTSLCICQRHQRRPLAQRNPPCKLRARSPSSDLPSSDSRGSRITLPFWRVLTVSTVTASR